MNDKPEPTPEEIEQAKYRLSQLDAISKRCDWSNVAPSWKAEQAREKWHRVMDIQSEFEAKYY